MGGVLVPKPKNNFVRAWPKAPKQTISCYDGGWDVTIWYQSPDSPSVRVCQRGLRAPKGDGFVRSHIGRVRVGPWPYMYMLTSYSKTCFGNALAPALIRTLKLSEFGREQS